MVRILVIGDPHGDLQKIKKVPINSVDLILLTGDLGSADFARKMAFENIERKRKGLEGIEFSVAQRKKAFMEAYDSSLNVVNYLSKKAPVYVIFGNVESRNDETREEAREIGVELPFLYNDLNAIDNVRVINNKVANFEGVRIGGLDYFIDTSWVKEFKPSEYKTRLKSAKKQSDKARRILKWFGGLDVLVCHQPPYGVLDKVGSPAPKSWRGKHAGSKVILDYVKKYHPKYVFCGHIHEGKGKAKVGESEVYNLGVGGYRVVDF